MPWSSSRGFFFAHQKMGCSSCSRVVQYRHVASCTLDSRAGADCCICFVAEAHAAKEQSERPSATGLLALPPPSLLAEMLPRVGLVNRRRDSLEVRPGITTLDIRCG